MVGNGPSLCGGQYRLVILFHDGSSIAANLSCMLTCTVCPISCLEDGTSYSILEPHHIRERDHLQFWQRVLAVDQYTGRHRADSNSFCKFPGAVILLSDLLICLPVVPIHLPIATRPVSVCVIFIAAFFQANAFKITTALKEQYGGPVFWTSPKICRRRKRNNFFLENSERFVCLSAARPHLHCHCCHPYFIATADTIL